VNPAKRERKFRILIYKGNSFNYYILIQGVLRMAAQKKKKLPKNSVNSGVFQWTPQRKKAAKLLSSGLYNYKSAAMETRITEDTLLAWRQQPVFLQEVDRLTFVDDNATRAAVVRKIMKAMGIKEHYISGDRDTFLDYMEFLVKIIPNDTKNSDDKLKALTDAIMLSSR